jgi:hypothetical protein
MELLRDLTRSKKFASLVLGVVASAGARLGLDAATAESVSQAIVALVGCYLVGQGVADHGKERAKVEAASVPR